MAHDKDKHNMRRYLDGTYTVAEAEEVHTSIKRCLENDDAMDELASEVWNEVNHHTLSYQDNKEARREAYNIVKKYSVKKTGWFRRIIYPAIAVAATIVLAFAVYHFITFSHEEKVLLTSVTTSYGEKKNITLSDGSTIILNSCSQLKYPETFYGKQRKVYLTGEAFFDISPNKKKPFCIDTKGFNVKVLGTEFNIKSYADDELTSVEVKSGKVQVNLPDANLRIKSDEQILINKQSGDFSKKKYENAVAAWRKGTLTFNATPIRDVAHMLERMYNCRIVFQEGHNFNSLISGEHDQQDLKSVLESICYVSGLKYKKTNGEILFYAK